MQGLLFLIVCFFFFLNELLLLHCAKYDTNKKKKILAITQPRMCISDIEHQWHCTCKDFEQVIVNFHYE